MLDPKNAHSGIFNRKQLDPHPYIEHTFVPKLRTVGALSSATLKQIRDEPMLFGADILHEISFLSYGKMKFSKTI
jgi:hypothetical protein